MTAPLRPAAAPRRPAAAPTPPLHSAQPPPHQALQITPLRVVVAGAASPARPMAL